MSYDLYVDHPEGDVATRLRLLVIEDAPLNKYLSLVHGQLDKKKQQRTRGAFNKLIADELQRLHALGIQPAAVRQMEVLPPGSWFLQFTFTLAKPWMSKDDDPFYVAESVNPVRKDKVFKVPMMSAASWKGLLRWTIMHTRLAQRKDQLAPERFAQERFVQTLLFGDEKGEEPEQKKGVAAYLDALQPGARTAYERLLRQHYHLKQDDPLPHHSGRLMFYPTFFDLIDVAVINPHRRETKAGTHPIYLECVPAEAKGAFSLLYVPFDRIGRDEAETRRQAVADLQLVAEGVQAMFLTYGFSAKRTSGFGVAEERLENGLFEVRVEQTTPAPPPAESAPTSAPSLPRYLAAPDRLKDEYLDAHGTFRERSETELKAMRKADRQEYEKAQKWWEREGKALAERPPVETPPEVTPLAPQWLRRAFDSFDQLRERAKEVAQGLQAGGEA